MVKWTTRRLTINIHDDLKQTAQAETETTLGASLVRVSFSKASSKSSSSLLSSSSSSSFSSPELSSSGGSSSKSSWQGEYWVWNGMPSRNANALDQISLEWWGYNSDTLQCLHNQRVGVVKSRNDPRRDKGSDRPVSPHPRPYPRFRSRRSKHPW